MNPRLSQIRPEGTAGQYPKVNGTADGWDYDIPAGGGSTPAFVGARAYRSAALTLTNNTVTAIGLDAESYDSGTLHDPTANNSRITVPTTGKYLATAVSGLSNAGIAYQLRLHINGTVYSLITPTTSTGGGVDSITDVLPLTAGDYVEMCMFQNSGSSQATLPGATNMFLSVALLGT